MKLRMIPYGYKVDSGKVTPFDKEVIVIHRIFDEYICLREIFRRHFFAFFEVLLRWFGQWSVDFDQYKKCMDIDKL